MKYKLHAYITRHLTNDQYIQGIQLTSGKVALVDADDYEYLSQWKWQYDGRYASRVPRVNGVTQKKLYMHRAIIGENSHKDIDHLNRNKLDNRRSNLKPCTRQENTRNRDLISTNTSGVTGVTWVKRIDKWMAQIRLNGKNIFLGNYDDINSAIEARKNGELKYWSVS